MSSSSYAAASSSSSSVPPSSSVKQLGSELTIYVHGNTGVTWPADYKYDEDGFQIRIQAYTTDLKWPYVVAVDRASLSEDYNKLPDVIGGLLAHSPVCIFGAVEEDDIVEVDYVSFIKFAKAKNPTAKEIDTMIDKFIDMALERSRALLIADALKQTSYLARCADASQLTPYNSATWDGKIPPIQFTTMNITNEGGITLNGAFDGHAKITVNEPRRFSVLQVSFFESNQIEQAEYSDGIRIIAVNNTSELGNTIARVAEHGDPGLQAVAVSTVRDPAKLEALVKAMVNRMNYQRKFKKPAHDVNLKHLAEKVKQLVK